MILNCEISILAKIKQNDVLLRLGDVIDAKTKNQKKLYDIHSHLYFLHVSHITLKNDESIEMTYENELSEIREKFGLSNNIHFHEGNTISNGTHEIEWIKLYDITCMQPVFTEEVSQLVPFTSNKSNNEKCVIILPPYNSAIKRGTLVESCISMCIKYNTTFLCINDENNLGNLYKKYLITRGICDQDIDVIPHVESVFENIMETISTINCLFSIDHIIYIAIDSENVCGLTMFLRKFREKKKTRKLFYICNSSWNGFLS
jgi:hypothetical protein